MKLELDWITGYVDGDGCFAITSKKSPQCSNTFAEPGLSATVLQSQAKVQHLGYCETQLLGVGVKPYQKNQKQFSFIVSQDQRSQDVLYALKKHFGCGSVKKNLGSKGNMAEFSITKPEHLRDKVVAHFRKYPLQTTKRIQFYKFAQSLHEYMTSVGQDPGPQLSATLCTAPYKLSAGWWRGIVDALGCFWVDQERLPKEKAKSNSTPKSFSLDKKPACLPLLVQRKNGLQDAVYPKFMIKMHSDEKKLIAECQRFIRCGTLLGKKEMKETNTFQVLQVTNLVEIETLLVPFFQTRGSAVLLRTIRRISFQKWRKIVRFLIEKRHLDLQGAEKIKRYMVGLNKHNETLKREKKEITITNQDSMVKLTV